MSARGRAGGGRAAERRSRPYARTGVGSAAGLEPDSGTPGDPEQPPGDPEAVARTICLRQLEHRARSRSELADTLHRRGVPADAAQRVLDRFTEVGLIDDQALAHSLAGAVHRERGLARRAVAAKLRSRGIDDDTIGAALATIDSDSERRRAQELVARRAPAMSALPAQVRVRRLVGLLARKGYPPGLSYEIVRAGLADTGYADDDSDAAVPQCCPDPADAPEDL